MTVPMPHSDVRIAASHLLPFSFRSLATTHAGSVRKLNEDAYLDRSDVGLWAVADGMGGHEAGDVASATIVDALAKVATFGSAFAFRRAVRTALLAVNGELCRKAAEEYKDTIGSTVVTLLAHGGHYACIWAGDSRAYLHRQGRLQRITRDHSLVQELIDAGAVDAGQAQGHRHANIVTRAVGASDRLELDGVYGLIQPGDRFLLCSDGLGVLTDCEIEARLGGAPLASAASTLLRLTLERGAPDNVTFVLVDTDAA